MIRELCVLLVSAAGCGAPSADPAPTVTPISGSPPNVVAGQSRVVVPPVVEPSPPAIPSGRELIALFPRDARELLASVQASPSAFDHYRLVPGSFRPDV